MGLSVFQHRGIISRHQKPNNKTQSSTYGESSRPIKLQSTACIHQSCRPKLHLWGKTQSSTLIVSNAEVMILRVLIVDSIVHRGLRGYLTLPQKKECCESLWLTLQVAHFTKFPSYKPIHVDHFDCIRLNENTNFLNSSQDFEKFKSTCLYWIPCLFSYSLQSILIEKNLSFENNLDHIQSSYATFSLDELVQYTLSN